MRFFRGATHCDMPHPTHHTPHTTHHTPHTTHHTTCHTPHTTCHTPHTTHHTPHTTCHTPHTTHHTPHTTHHTPHTTHHMSHTTHHTPHITCHTPHRRRHTPIVVSLFSAPTSQPLGILAAGRRMPNNLDRITDPADPYWCTSAVCFAVTFLRCRCIPCAPAGPLFLRCTAQMLSIHIFWGGIGVSPPAPAPSPNI